MAETFSPGRQSGRLPSGVNRGLVARAEPVRREDVNALPRAPVVLTRSTSTTSRKGATKTSVIHDDAVALCTVRGAS
jgi:hypothetical protein